MDTSMVRTSRRWAVVAILGAPLLPIRAIGLDAAAPPRVEFPALAAAREAIVDDRVEPYFSLLRPHDMSAKTGSPIGGGTIEAQRAECRRRYRASVAEFTAAEQEFIRGILGKMQPVLAADFPRLAALPWSFLKVGNDIEGGLPHTRGRHIVLPVQILGEFDQLRKRSGEEAAAEAGMLLAHEQMHVFQRANPRHFDALYANVWGFRRVPRIEGCAGLDAVEVANPDATDLGWVFPIRAGGAVRWIWPRVLFRDAPPAPGGILRMPHDFRMVAVELEETKEGFRAKRDAQGKPVLDNLMAIPEYTRVFSGTYYTFHPAEATADLFGKVVAFDAFAPKDRLPKEALDKEEKEMDPIRARFREFLLAK
jgi:hypothetical protein